MAKHRKEILRDGQSTNEVIKVNNTVHRSLSKNSQFVHDLLTFLERNNFKYSPRYKGIDADGKEIVTYIEGEIIRSESRWTKKQLVAVTTVLKTLHDLCQHFPGKGNFETITHGDFAPWNLVTVKGFPVGIIDFDDAVPGNRVDELAYMLWTFLDLGNPNVSIEDQLDDIQVVCKAYGYPSGEKLVKAIIKQQQKILRKRKVMAIESDNKELQEFSAVRVNEIEDQIEWVEKHRGQIVNAV